MKNVAIDALLIRNSVEPHRIVGSSSTRKVEMETRFRQQYLRARTTASIPWQALGSGNTPRLSSLGFEPPITRCPDGTVFPAEPSSEEREGRASETVVGSPRGSHLGTVESLLLWVSRNPGAKGSRTLTSISVRSRWLAWTCTAIDFFCVELSTDDLEDQIDHEIVSRTSLDHLSRSHCYHPRARRCLLPSRCCSFPLAG